MPRLYREVAAELDLGGLGQRAVPRRAARAWRAAPAALEAFFAEVERGRAAPTRASTRFVDASRGELADPEDIESRARRIVERMALALQGSLLVRFGDPAVADAFCASRLDGDAGPRLRHAAGGHRLRRASSSAIRSRRSSAPAARGWKTPPDGGVGALQARLPGKNRVRGRAGRRGRRAARRHDPGRGEQGRGAS